MDVNHSGITDAGDTISYSFTVTNTGNVPISGISVSDPRLPVTCPPTPLAPGASMSCGPVVYTVTVADEVAGTVDNTAVAHGTDPDGGSIASPPDSTSTPATSPAPKLLLDKVAHPPVDVNGSGITDAGDTISYSFTVTNTGNVPITGVAIDDPTLSPTPIPCTPATLAPGASANCGPVVHTVTHADEAAGSVDNTATARGADPDGGGVVSPPDSTSTPTSSPASGLVLDKVAHPPVDVNGSGITDAGDTISYSFTVTNTGNVPIKSVAVADPMLSATPIACAPSTLAPGASGSCGPATHTVTTADEAAGHVANSAIATGTDPDGAAVVSPPDTTSTPVIPPEATLVIDKHVAPGGVVDVNNSGITDAGDTISYSFTVTNTGNVPIHAVAVSDPTLASSSIGITCTAATLAPGATTTCVTTSAYVVKAADEQNGAVVNTAKATGVDPDGGAVVSPPDTESVPTTTPQPGLSIEKVAAPPVDTDVPPNGAPDVGDAITYTFRVRNTGNVPLTAPRIVDPMFPSGQPAPLDHTHDCTSVAVLPVGAPAQDCITLTHTITAADLDTGIVHNTATGHATDPNGDPVVSPPASVTTTLDQQPALRLVKTAGTPVDVNHSGLTDAGDTIVYSFAVTNTGNVSIADIGIFDFRLDAAGVAVTCAAAVLPAGAATTCTSDPYVITAQDVADGHVVNSAAATGTAPTGDVVSAPSSTDVPTTMPQASMVLVKSAGVPVDVNHSGITDAGDTISYSFTVTNTGNVPIAGVAVVDAKVSASPIPCAGVLAPGATVSCGPVPTYVVTAADVDAGVVHNVAVANGTDPDGQAVSSPQATTSTPTSRPVPGLSLVKSAGAPVDVNGSGLTDAGDTISYSFTVTNTGNVPVNGVHVDDAMVSSSPIGCVPATLAPGASVACGPVTYTVTAADETAGVVANHATSSATDPDGGPVVSPPATTATPVATPFASMVLVKSAGVPVDVNHSGITDAGDTISYSFTVTNTGNVPIAGVAVVDAKVSASPIPCAGVLAPGATVSCGPVPTYVVTAADVDAGVVHNVAVANGTDPDGQAVSSPQATTSTPTSRPVPGLSLVKSAGAPVDVNGSGLTDAGDTISYSFTVTNTGNVPVNGVHVDDAMVSSSPIGCVPATLAPGASVACGPVTYTVTAADETAGVVANHATSSATDPDGGPVVSPPATTSTPASVPQPALQLAKSAGAPTDTDGDGMVEAGDTITYTFTVTNTGNVPITAVDVHDDRVTGMTCPQGPLAPTASVACTADPYVLSPADVDAGGVTNHATATGTDPDDGSVESPPATATSTIPRVPRLVLDKQASPVADTNQSGDDDAGDAITYTFVVTNVGNVTLTDPQVIDSRVAPITCPAATLSPGQATTCTASPYTMTQADVDAGSVQNVAAASASDGPDTVTSPEDSTSTTINGQGALHLVKTASLVDRDGDHAADVGEHITYSFLVTNTGTVTLSPVTVNDPNVTGVACPTTVLAVGESMTCSADYVVTPADVASGQIVNTATAHAGGEVGVVSDPSTATVEAATDPAPLAPVDPPAFGIPAPATPAPAPDAPAVTPTGPLAFTGSDIMLVVVAALLAMGVGIALVSGTRSSTRRRGARG